MANIYLRLPLVVCYYHRNYDMNHKLRQTDPMKFSPYTDHAVIMRGGLAIFKGDAHKVGECYSQNEWNNICQGKNPSGNKVVNKRNAADWPSYVEVCQSEGVRMSNRSDSFDYLCIQMPNSVLIADKETRTNGNFSLSEEAAHILQELLVRDFQRALIDWEIGTQDYCISPDRIIRRGHMETLERFLMRYDIPVPKNGVEKDSLRRQLDRWKARARVLEKAYRCIDIEYEDPRDKVVHCV